MASTSIDPTAIEALADALAEKIVARLPQWEAEDGWMTSARAADYLSIPISTLRKLTAAGTVPFSQDAIGGRCYFKRSELDRWRAHSAQGSAVEIAVARGKIGPANRPRKWPRDVAPSGAVAQGGRAP